MKASSEPSSVQSTSQIPTGPVRLARRPAAPAWRRPQPTLALACPPEELPDTEEQDGLKAGLENWPRWRDASGAMGPRGTSRPGLEQHLPAGTVIRSEGQRGSGRRWVGSSGFGTALAMGGCRRKWSKSVWGLQEGCSTATANPEDTRLARPCFPWQPFCELSRWGCQAIGHSGETRGPEPRWPPPSACGG